MLTYMSLNLIYNLVSKFMITSLNFIIILTYFLFAITTKYLLIVS